jgi:hypothetical protein
MIIAHLAIQLEDIWPFLFTISLMFVGIYNRLYKLSERDLLNVRYQRVEIMFSTR